MAGRRPALISPVPKVQTPGVKDAPTQRALETLTAAVHKLEANRAVTARSVTGSRSSGEALENLLTVLEALGYITDNTEP